MRTLFVICFLLLLEYNNPAQNSFLRIYPGESGQQGFYCGSIPTCLEKTNGGGFLIGGYTCDPDTPGMQLMQLRKIDANGNIIWDVKDRVTTYDEINDVVAYDDTTIFCAVRLLGSHAGLVKRNGQGSILWFKDLFPIADTCTGINSMIKASDGNLLMVGGYYDCGGADVDIIVAKTDTGGNFIWRNIIHLPYSSSASSIIETTDSNYLVAGGTGYIDTIAHLGITQFFVAKYNQLGNQLSFKTYGDAQLGFFGGSIAILSNNNLAVAGGCVYYPYDDAALIILNDTGDLTNYFIDTIPDDNLYWRIKKRGDYAYLLESSSEFRTSDTSADFKLQRYSTLTGNIDFSKSYTLLGSQGFPYDMEVLSNGSIAISFYAQDSVCLGCTGFVVLDSSGCVPEWCATVIWEVEETQQIQVYPNPFNQLLQITGIENAEARVFDYTGREVFSENNIGSNKAIELPALCVGLYLIEIKKGEMKWTKKLMHF